MLELTHPNEIKYTYHEPGYWVIHNPFQSGIDEYVNWCYSQNLSNKKITAHNNPFRVKITEDNFDTQNVVKNLLKPFYANVVGQSSRPYFEEQSKGWLNLYDPENLKCRLSSGLPHNDCCESIEGIVANYWISDDIEQSSTKFYKFNGKLIKDPYGEFNLLFDFTQPNHLKFNEYKKFSTTICTKFPNIKQETLKYFGYEYEGEAPAEPWKMTIYEFKRPHTAYIPSSIKHRFSSCFLYGQVPHPWFRDS